MIHHRIGIVGAGVMAEEHLTSLKRLGLGRVMGLCDLSESIGRFMARRHGVEHVFTDLGTMLRQIRPSVVHVLTPPATHEPLVERCLRSGAHVLVEKPVALSAEGFDRLWQIASDRSLLLMEDHNYRLNRICQQLLAAIESNDAGPLHEIEVRMTLGSLFTDGGRYGDRNLAHPSYRLPCGVVHEFLTHLIYLSHALLDADRSSDRAPLQLQHAVWEDRGLGPCGLDALLSSGRTTVRLRLDPEGCPDGFELLVRGCRAVLRADLFQPCLERSAERSPAMLSGLINQWRRGRVLKKSALKNFRAKVGGWTPYEGLTEMVRGFYRAAEGRSESPVSRGQMHRTLEVIEALAASRTEASTS
ncbi:MAG: Gfo/Idh/MocA family oxidoreductase [Phycisphaeraceae bacterium]|nr:Gfo/Idh/MocA family oxidoreductase [Phycisphaeraceae bacterium]